MKTIQPTNIRTPKSCQPQKCPDCYLILQQIDNVKYCENCKKCPILMDASLREPNYNFKQHFQYQDNKIPSAVIKIQSHAKDIMCKLGMRVTDSEIDRIVGMVRDMHWSRGSRCKGYRQETALIIYRIFQDQIRMTIHQFCTKTGIVKKKFNKMLIYYQNMKNNQLQANPEQKLPKIQDDIYQSDSFEIKQQQLHELPNQQQHPDYQHTLNQSQQYHFATYINPQNLKLESYHLKNPQPNQQNNEGIQFNEREQRQILSRTIQILYDKIFTGDYLKKHRNQLTKNIIQKSLVLYQEFLGCGDGNIPKKYFRAPAIIYNVIKSHGCKISKKKYTQAVEKHLEVKLTDRMISKFAMTGKKTPSKNDEDDEGSSPTSLENRETPTKSQPLGV